MFELLSSGIFGSLIGGIFRLAPEILKWLDRRDERTHELQMFQLQTDLEKVKGSFRMEEKYVDHSTEQLRAIQEAFREQGQEAAASYKWVAALSALVRPGVTYILFGLYCTFKVVTAIYAFQQGASWLSILQNSWDQEDFAMLNMILTFWFVGRTIEKYQGAGVQ